MPTIGVAKTRAKILRDHLAKLGHKITHTESLELIADIHGFRNWNTLLGVENKNMALLPTPTGWLIAGDAKQHFELGCDQNLTRNNSHPAIIRSITSDHISGFVTLMQSIKPDKYHGQRVRLTAELKSLDCRGAVTIWMRADGEKPGEILAFDNMEMRSGEDAPLTDTMDWQDRQVVLDVPAETTKLNYGFYLRGNGTAWASNFRIDIVSENIDVTSIGNSNILDAPNNLNFNA